MLVPSAFHPHIGGVEQVTERLARGLLDRGVSVLVVTNQEPRDLPAQESTEGLEVVRIPFRVPHRSVRGMGSWLVLSRRSRRRLNDLAADVDVINVHCVSSQATYVRAVARALHVPLVVTTHGELSGDASGTYQRDRAAMRAWRRLVAQADLLTAPSRHTLEEAETFFGQPLRSSRVIPNGVDLELFGSARDSGESSYVLAVGRLVGVKGFDLLVGHWHTMPGDVRLVIVGDGPERSTLEALRRASPAAERIELVGARSRQEVADLMRGARALALTSHQEALGLVVLEAMAAGTPVVASRVGGVPEIVEDGVTGLLFEPGDAAGLVAGLTSIIEEPEAARERAERAGAFAAGFGWDAAIDRYLDVYEQTGRTA